MYLSRVEIDVNNRQKTKDLTHLGAYHNWVEHCFPEEIKAGKRCRHLWRIDPLDGKKYLLLVSEEAPDLQQMEVNGVAGTAITKSYDQFLDSLKEGQLMQFRLTANPTHAIPKLGSDQPRIVPHIRIDDQRGWLVKRSAGRGFQLVQQASIAGLESEDDQAFNIVNRDFQILRKGHHTVRLSRVTFEGYLRIDDLKRFKKTLVSGIGREKAFGMGLMTVIPAK